MIAFQVTIQGADDLAARLHKFPERMPQLFYNNFQVLGKRIAYLMRRELQVTRTTGRLQGSVSSEMDMGALQLTVGPTANHAMFVRMGTRPHWAPIGPLKEWAAIKLGDENLAYPIQRAIAKYGTNRYYAKKGLAGATQTQFGIGLDFPRTTLERGDTQTAITNTARRLGTDLVATIEKGA